MEDLNEFEEVTEEEYAAMPPAFKKPILNKEGNGFVEGWEGEAKEKYWEKVKQVRDMRLNVDNYSENAMRFYEAQPYFYDRRCIFWFWNFEDFKYVQYDETDVLNIYDLVFGFGGISINQKIKSNTLEAMKRFGRRKIPKDPEKSWIQFKNKIFDYKTKTVSDASPDYFICNPIPWDLGESEDTPTIDKLFVEWVGEKYKQTLYEIIAYCCTTDYPIHSLFCLIGIGCNGKTQFQLLIANFVGKENISCTELDNLLENRFESTRLFKKLVCIMGETNFGIISKTSLLKKLTGQDLIGFEYKNKNLFDDYNYAKILINSNSLPSSDDTSEGFYRRWLIIDFPNKFKEGKGIVETIPTSEYNALALKITKIVPNLIERGSFTNQGTVEERKERYILASNPLPFFLSVACERSYDKHIRYSELYIAYVKFLGLIKRRVVSRKEFGKSLETESLEARRTSHKNEMTDIFETTYFVEGLDLKKGWEEDPKTLCTLCTLCTDFKLPLHIQESNVEKTDKVYKVYNPTLISYGEPRKLQFFDAFGGNQEVEIQAGSREDVFKILGLIPKDNKGGVDLLFEKHLLVKMLEEGDIFEMPEGTYKRVDVQ